MEINDILNGFNDCSDYNNCDCEDNLCGFSNNNCGCNGFDGCGNNSWLLLILLLACCSRNNGYSGGYGGYGNMGYGFNDCCCCCCCEKPKFKKCKQTVYVPENNCGLMGGYNNYPGYGSGNDGFGFGGDSCWWIIIILLICCCGNNGFGNCGCNNC